MPKNVKFLIIFGAFLIFNTWLLDHWFVDDRDAYRLFGRLDIRSFGYSVGFSLISICFILMIVKSFIGYGTIVNLRRKYSIKKLDKTFHLIWFNKWLYLFDNDREEYFHIHPWGTAQDLGFTSYGVKTDEPLEKAILVDIGNGKTIEIKKYADGGMINTRD